MGKVLMLALTIFRYRQGKYEIWVQWGVFANLKEFGCKGWCHIRCEGRGLKTAYRPFRASCFNSVKILVFGKYSGRDPAAIRKGLDTVPFLINSVGCGRNFYIGYEMIDSNRIYYSATSYIYVSYSSVPYHFPPPMFENGRISCAFQFLSNLSRQKKGANNHKKKEA